MSIGRKVARGALWTVMVRFALRFIGLISTMILARLLTPADFGIVALAGTVVTAMEMLTAFGFEVVLIREKNPPPDRYNTVWTLSVLRGIVLALIALVIGPFASDFFAEPRLDDVFAIIALSPLLHGLHNVGLVDFRKNLQFHREFHFLVTSKVLEFIATVSLAFIWRDYWALIVGIVLSQAIKLLLSYTMHPFRPRGSLRGAASIMSFSIWLLLNAILGFTLNRSDKFFVARMVGTVEVGFYSMAYELSNLATTELISPVRRVILPGYSKVAANREKLTNLYLDGLSVMLLLGLPVAIGIAAVAQPLVAVVLGDQWGAVVPLIEILTLCGAIRVAGANAGPIFVALGKPHVTTLRQLICVVIGLPLLALLTGRHGATGTAVAITIIAALSQGLTLAAAAYELDIRVRTLLGMVWRILASCTGMYLTVGALDRVLIIDGAFADLVRLVALIAAAIVVQTSALLALWWMCGRPEGAEAIALRALSERLRAKK